MQTFMFTIFYTANFSLAKKYADVKAVEKNAFFSNWLYILFLLPLFPFFWEKTGFFTLFSTA